MKRGAEVVQGYWYVILRVLVEVSFERDVVERPIVCYILFHASKYSLRSEQQSSLTVHSYKTNCNCHDAASSEHCCGVHRNILSTI